MAFPQIALMAQGLSDSSRLENPQKNSTMITDKTIHSGGT
jgi:hypothetical protein